MWKCSIKLSTKCKVYQELFLTYLLNSTEIYTLYRQHIKKLFKCYKLKLMSSEIYDKHLLERPHIQRGCPTARYQVLFLSCWNLQLYWGHVVRFIISRCFSSCSHMQTTRFIEMSFNDLLITQILMLYFSMASVFQTLINTILQILVSAIRITCSTLHNWKSRRKHSTEHSTYIQPFPIVF